MASSWHVVVCKIGQEDRAEDNLGSQGFECYNPGMYVERVIKGETVGVKQPLFPDYVFVKFDPEIQSARTINYTYGVQTLLRFGDILAVMDEKIINALKDRMKKPVAAEIQKKLLAVGEEVELGGIFKGIKAIFLEADGERRSILMMKMLGTEQKLSIDNSAIV